MWQAELAREVLHYAMLKVTLAGLSIHRKGLEKSKKRPKAK